jgi:bacteriorhodopsin
MRKNIDLILIVLAVIGLLCMVFLPFVTGRNRVQPQVGRLRVGNTSGVMRWAS